MTIQYPDFFFHLVRPSDVKEKLKAAINDPKTLEAVGVEDPRMLVEYVRDNTEDDEIRMGACKLFPLPDQHELFGFRFKPPPEHAAYLVTSAGVFDVGRAAVALDDDKGASTWVRTYRKMVHDWCAAHRAERLAAAATL
ncbi:hypothetical protein EST38_g11012 [Candolleomyces aberdarensis]|uniref:Uncharacterized protein n=1 Tax=Candolleomyces aberdarensis TaxID=2316362 RepID=A0A4Q2D7I8_9AGAR|nr:hypothetical protein EST38_g11012 [Candolleomyces aberdarensis]